MKRAATLGLAAACFLCAGPAARAGLITSSASNTWSYQFSAQPPFTFFDKSNHQTVITMPGNSSSVTSNPGTTTSISTRLYTVSNAPVSDPLPISAMPYTLDLKITSPNGKVSDFVYTGTLNGEVWKNGSTLTPTIPLLTSSAAPGSDPTFDVKFDSFRLVSGAGPFQGVVFNFDVSYHNPEPSSLVLAGIGVPLFGLFLRRRR